MNLNNSEARQQNFNLDRRWNFLIHKKLDIHESWNFGLNLCWMTVWEKMVQRSYSSGINHYFWWSWDVSQELGRWVNYLPFIKYGLNIKILFWEFTSQNSKFILCTKYKYNPLLFKIIIVVHFYIQRQIDKKIVQIHLQSFLYFNNKEFKYFRFADIFKCIL